MKQPNQVCAYLLARVKTAGKINFQITTTNKKVTKVSKVVSSSSPKIQDDSEVAKRIKSKKATLKRSGKVNDAVSVLQELYSQ